MTISSTTNRAQFNCDGSTTSFPFTFRYLEASDLQVYLASPTGTVTLLTLNVDYQITPAIPGPGGTLSFLGGYLSSPPGSGYTLTILRFVPRTQEVDFINGDSLDENNIEGMGDKLTMMVQDLDERIGRAVTAPPSSSLSGIQLPTPEAGKFIRWNSVPDNLENATIADASVQVINEFWTDILAAAGSTLAEALAAMGLDPSLATLTLPDNVTVSDFAKTLLDDADADAARATLQIPRKNAIINGDMMVWQRGTSFAASADGAFHADRWSHIAATDAVVTVSRSTNVPTDAQGEGRFAASLQVDVTTADASIGSGQAHAIRYKVEGYDIRSFVGQVCTLSFWVAATKPGIYCINLLCAGADRSYVKEYTINSANTWEKKTITFTLDASSGTWDFTNGVGLQIRWTLAAGSNYRVATDGVWGTALYATANQVNGLDSTDNSFLLTGVQLEKGSVATPFEFTSFEEELALCQRYYEKSHNCSFAPGTSGAHQVGNLYVAVLSAYEAPGTRFAVTKRTAPTITIYSPVDGASGKCYSGGANRDATAGYIGEASFGYITGSSYTTPLQYHWVADAEL